MTQLTAKELKLQLIWLEQNPIWKNIVKSFEAEMEKLEKLILEKIDKWVYADPNKAVATLHEQHLLKKRYESLSRVLEIPNKIRNMKTPDEAKIQKKIKESL